MSLCFLLFGWGWFLRHFCLTFVNCDVGTTAGTRFLKNAVYPIHTHTQTRAQTHTQSISLSLNVRSCRDEGSVTPSLLPKERSVQVHSYITQPVTAAALCAKREKGTDVQREGKERREMILVYGELYPSKQPCLPPSAIVGVNWRSQSTSWVLSVFACHLVRCGGAEEKRNESSTAHITGGSLGLSASASRIPRGEKEEKKKKHPQKKESSRERRKKALPYAFIGDCMLFVVTQNFRGHWFSRKWIWGAIFFHFTFSSVCLKSGYWNPSSATLFSAHLEAIQALLLNICRLQTLFFPLSPLDQSLLYSTWPLFGARVSLLSQGFALHPSFLLTPCPSSDSPSPALFHTLCRRRVALLRYLRLLNSFHLPR